MLSGGGLSTGLPPAGHDSPENALRLSTMRRTSSGMILFFT